MNETYQILCAIILPSAIIAIPHIPGITAPAVKNVPVTRIPDTMFHTPA